MLLPNSLKNGDEICRAIQISEKIYNFSKPDLEAALSKRESLRLVKQLLFHNRRVTGEISPLLLSYQNLGRFTNCPVVLLNVAIKGVFIQPVTLTCDLIEFVIGKVTPGLF
jgi:hypothetical protein